MSDQPGSGLDRLDLEIVRRIEAVCRRFEADWRAGRSPAVGDYLGEFPEPGRASLRAELEGLDGELRHPEETVAQPDPVPGPAAPPGHHDGPRIAG
ncbi:MAG TPA: hypothetical protein VKW77_00420, partial [Acidimicrobiales bacterium]|nr:hypothetical protein [Acidimicrobiales bacterium]